MTIRFLYGRRESLYGKSETFKKSVRGYLESIGFSQTVDSSVEGSFEDMIFFNPQTSPGKKYIIEAKSEVLSPRTKKLARELIKYFRLSRKQENKEVIGFLLFVQGVKKSKEWESIFNEIDNIEAVQEWCDWYNNKCIEKNESILDEQTVKDLATFFSNSEVTVGSHIDLQQAVLEKQATSSLSISRTAKNLFDLVNRRKSPISAKSKITLNILSITIPEYYYDCKSLANSKQEIYDDLKETILPPFLFTSDKHMLTFAEFDNDNPLKKFMVEPSSIMNTKELQLQNPTFCSELVNIHFRRILWNKGLYRDPKANIYYFPMIDEDSNIREVIDQHGRNRWVVKEIIHREDTKYHKKGDVNFFFHRGVELRTPTYWGFSFVEMIPRRYYTLNGKNWIDGEIRSRIDKRFRNPKFDRSKARLGLMKFWKFFMFESQKFALPSEKWFDKFQFGDFLTKNVNWSPKVVGRSQMILWDFKGDELDA